LFEPDDDTEVEDTGFFEDDTELDNDDEMQVEHTGVFEDETELDNSDEMEVESNKSDNPHDDSTQTDNDSTTSEEIIPSKKIRTSFVPETQPFRKPGASINSASLFKLFPRRHWKLMWKVTNKTIQIRSV